MKLADLFEEQKEVPRKKLVVVLGGRFEPFHKGHFGAYEWLCDKFGADNVWIATSNKTNFDPAKGKISPWNFAEKKEIMVKLYKIPPRRIIESDNPAFAPKEVWKQYKGFEPVYLAAVGKKDTDRYKNGDFFLPVPKDVKLPKGVTELDPVHAKRGYYLHVPTMEAGISGTSIREAIKAATSKHLVKQAMEEGFGRYDRVIADLLKAKCDEIKEEKPEPKPKSKGEPVKFPTGKDESTEKSDKSDKKLPPEDAKKSDKLAFPKEAR